MSQTPQGSSPGGLFNLGSNTFSSLSTGVGDLGGAAGSIFGAIGSFEAAGSYGTEAAIAGENEGLEAESVKVQQYQADRRINETIGSQAAGVAANGFANSGTALSLLKDSTTQGHMTDAMINLQGDIQENAYYEQQQAALAQESAATAGGIAGIAGGVMKAVSGVASLASILAV
jgi:hypothetical protein